MRTVHFLYDLIIKALGNDQSGIRKSFVKEALHEICLEGTEDVSCAKVDPGRGFQGLFCHGLTVKGRKPVTGPLKRGGIHKSAVI